MEITLNQAKEAVIRCIEVGLVPILSSQPALGKSSMIAQVAKELNLELIDLRLGQCEPTDLLGLPKVGESKAKYVPMNIFPLVSDNKPRGKKGWLLFLDEIRNADTHTMMAAYKLVLDRMVGEYHLHPNCYIVCAGNREEDGCYVTPMPNALKSRLIHLNIRIDKDEWLDYAVSNDFDSRITTFIQFKPSYLATAYKDSAEESYGSPRTWEFTNKLIKGRDITDITTRALLSGALSEGVATEFLAYIKYFDKLPAFESIVANPKKAKVPDSDDLGFIWATIGMLIDNFKMKHLEKIMTYIERLPSEYQFLFMKDICKRNTEVLTQDCVQPWIDKLVNIKWS